MATRRNPYASTEDQGFLPGDQPGDWTPNVIYPGTGIDPSRTSEGEGGITGRGTPSPVDTASAPGATPPPFDLDAWYQSAPGFNRAPDDNERATDMANIEKYGPEAFMSDFQKRTAQPQQTQLRSPGAMTPGFKGTGQASDLMATLKGLFPGGLFNQDIVNRRTDNARDQLNRFGKSRMASNRAQLANRGTLGSGPEISALNRTESDIADRFANAENEIYSNESENADARMMQALGLASNLSMDDARNAIDWFRANTDRGLGYGRLDLDKMLGTGDLALRNSGQSNQYNLDLARLGLDRDRLLHEMENGNIDQLIALIQQLFQGSNQSSNGYI